MLRKWIFFPYFLWVCQDGGWTCAVQVLNTMELFVNTKKLLSSQKSSKSALLPVENFSKNTFVKGPIVDEDFSSRIHQDFFENFLPLNVDF